MAKNTTQLKEMIEPERVNKRTTSVVNRKRDHADNLYFSDGPVFAIKLAQISMSLRICLLKDMSKETMTAEFPLDTPKQDVVAWIKQQAL